MDDESSDKTKRCEGSRTIEYINRQQLFILASGNLYAQRKS